MPYIERNRAIAVIEQKQRELCPYGLYGRNYVYGSDRDAFDNFEEIIDALQAIPAVNVIPVKHSWWIKGPSEIGSIDVEVCSSCGCSMTERNQFWDAKYCPNCGAKMDIWVGKEKDT